MTEELTAALLDDTRDHLRSLSKNAYVRFYSRRFFRHLTDAQLLAWRPSPHNQARSANISKANREYRRRAARAGFSNVYDWMRSVQR